MQGLFVIYSQDLHLRRRTLWLIVEGRKSQNGIRHVYAVGQDDLGLINHVRRQD